MDSKQLARLIRFSALYVRDETQALERAAEARRNVPASIATLRACIADLSRLVDDFEAAPAVSPEAAPVTQAAE